VKPEARKKVVEREEQGGGEGDTVGAATGKKNESSAHLPQRKRGWGTKYPGGKPAGPGSVKLKGIVPRSQKE